MVACAPSVGAEDDSVSGVSCGVSSIFDSVRLVAVPCKHLSRNPQQSQCVAGRCILVQRPASALEGRCFAYRVFRELIRRVRGRAGAWSEKQPLFALTVALTIDGGLWRIWAD